MINYVNIAKIAYAKDEPEKLAKAIAAATQLDNSLKKEYTSKVDNIGSTKTHFRIDQYLKYFSYEALAHRNELLNDYSR